MSIWINLLNRATHTGTQPLSTIEDAGTAAAEDTGTATGDIPILEDVGGSPGLPAVDGSQLTNLPSGGAHALGSHTDTNLGTPGAGEDTYVIGWDNTNSEYILQEMSGGGGVTITGDLPGVQARRTTTYSMPATWADVPFDTTDIESVPADVEHTSADQITLHDTGLYMIQYQLQVSPSVDPNNVDNPQARLRINDTTVIDGSLSTTTVHSDESIPGETTHFVAGHVLYDCQVANEVVSLQAQDISSYGAGAQPVIDVGATLQVLRLGVAGGAGGSSTWIDLTDTDPTTYVGQAGKIVTVNTAEDGLEFTVVGGTGTVTSVAVSGSDGLQVDSGSPITTTGTIALGVDAVGMRSHINVEDGSTADQTAAEIEAIVAHDNLLNVNAAEHIDWTQDQGATNIDPDNIPEVTAIAPGLAPASGGGTTNYLRADGLWQSPPAAGAEVNDLTSAVTWTNVPDVNITESSVTQHEAAIDHDALTNTGGNAHIDWTLASQGTVHATNYSVDPIDTEQLVIDARSSSGTITAGQAAYITGWDVGAGFISVELAKADGSGTMPAYGIAKSTIGTSTTGQLVVSGSLEAIDTTAIEGTSPAAGDAVYVSAATAGALTIDKPTGANLIQKIGTINRINATLGVVQVFGAGRSNDVPNIPDGQAWVGNGSGVATATDFDFTSLGDAPSSYSGLANSLIRVNTGETALEFAASPVGVTSAGQLSAAQLTSTGNLTVGDTILIDEVAAPLAPGGVPGQGQIYVKDDTPNTLKFVDDAGTEFDLSDKSYVHTHEGNTIDATGVNDGYVLTADGADGAAWEVATAGGAPITVEDEGTPLTTGVTRFNFVGAGVTTTEDVTDKVTVTIPLSTAPVSTVFTRTGDVVAVAGDYGDTQITNTSSVSGAFVKNALDTLGTHAALTNEHLDWTADQGATNIDAGNLPVFTSVAVGAVPASGGASTDFLSADGTWTSPAGATEVNDLSATVTWANVPDANITESSVTQHTAAVVTTSAVTTAGALMDSEVDADIKTLALPASTTISPYGATLVDDLDESTARTTLGAASLLTTISAGTGLTGGGSLAANRTIGLSATTDTAISDNTTHRGLTTNPHATDLGNLGAGTLSELNAAVADAHLHSTHAGGDVTGEEVLTIEAGAVDIAMLSATGTPSSSTYLRGDNTWNTPAGGGGTGDKTLVSNATVDVDASEIVIGGAYIDGSTGGTYAWEMLGTYNDNGGTGNQDIELRLYDRGPDGTPVAGVLRSVLEITSLDTLDRVAITLTASASPGVDTDTIYNTARMYEVRAYLDAGGAVDTSRILSCVFTET